MEYQCGILASKRYGPQVQSAVPVQHADTTSPRILLMAQDWDVRQDFSAKYPLPESWKLRNAMNCDTPEEPKGPMNSDSLRNPSWRTEVTTNLQKLAETTETMARPQPMRMKPTIPVDYLATDADYWADPYQETDAEIYGGKLPSICGSLRGRKPYCETQSMVETTPQKKTCGTPIL